MAWATSLPILVFPGLSVLDLGPMYVTTGRRQTASSLNAPAYEGWEHSILSLQLTLANHWATADN